MTLGTIGRRTGLLLALPVLVALACTTVLGGPTGATQAPGVPTDQGAETPDAAAEATAQAQLVFGAGAFTMPDTKAGLADLASFQETLTLTFDGTRDGNTQQWSKTSVMLTTKEPAARQITIEKQGDLPDLTPVYVAEVDGVAYELHGENSCTAAVFNPEDSTAQALEPAGLLTGVIGADEAGQETVNDVVANHYTFDERALALLDIAQSTGELWVAADGGYLVKYVLTTAGGADYFGAGIEGTLTWDYELTNVNQPVAIDLPKDCPAGLVDVPQLPDAADIQSSPGVLAYSTASSLADALAFYLDELPGLGWQLAGDPALVGTPAPEQTTAVLDFTQDDQKLTVIVSAGEGGTQVRIVLSSGAE